ncbi:endocuticle structural glycoprotein SgAbd-5-like [Leguminivora glycinivorella]|uniref:endocuticle structural glycoprotein SgAbd-5-like n=1 Tax=Leguminivora glycinivorella TaxID=1035111 RepID=UPI00200EAB50|nr:endocuticle structural glycoprotein SgAbd-5-like [Leguminivora glycinivorella]
MHKYAIVTLALCAVALAAPQQGQQPVEILKHDAIVGPEGYHFEFETSDGTARQEQGTLKQISEEHKAIEVQGSYKYTAPDGVVYTVTYTAGENGFQPQEHVDQAQGQQYQQ